MRSSLLQLIKLQNVLVFIHRNGRLDGPANKEIATKELRQLTD